MLYKPAVREKIINKEEGAGSCRCEDGSPIQFSISNTVGDANGHVDGAAHHKPLHDDEQEQHSLDELV